MGKFDGFLLVSDFDGTLIDGDLSISDENIAAVTQFIEQGGRFLGATGRTEYNVRPYARGLPMTSPWILYNGAAIYDWQSETFIHKSILDRALTETFVRCVIDRFPEINVQVFSGGPFNQVNRTGLPDHHALREAQHFEDRPMEEITDDWLKVLFCSDDPAQIDGVEALFDDDPVHHRAHKTRSAVRYFELTSLGVNKGSALARLRQMLDPEPRQVVAIGDYFNDIEMLQEADIAASPESALPDVKKHADIITLGHTQSAIADLVSKLAAYV